MQTHLRRPRTQSSMGPCHHSSLHAWDSHRKISEQRSRSAALPIPHRHAEESQERLLEKRPWLPHRKGQCRLSQKKVSDLFKKGFEFPEILPTESLEIRFSFPHTVCLRHKGDQSTGETSNNKSQCDISSTVMTDNGTERMLQQTNATHTHSIFLSGN